MANKKQELIPVKFLANVVHAGAIRLKDSVLEVTEEEALKLIEGKFANEHKPAPTPAQ